MAGTNGQSGTLSVTVQATIAVTALRPFATASASGTVHVGGTTTALSGTYDSATNSVSLSGSGYTLTGTVRGGVLSGTFAFAPSGSAGGFSALSSTTGSIAAYCGTFSGAAGTTCSNSAPGVPCSGTWNLQVAPGGAMSGEGIQTGPPQAQVCGPAFLTGQLTGSSFSGTAVQPCYSSDTQSIAGTVEGGTVNGTISGGNGTAFGTFTGKTCGQ